MQLLRRWRFWVLLAIGLAGIGSSMLLWSVHEHQRVETVELDRLNQQSKVIEDSLSRQLLAVQLSLATIAADVPSWYEDNAGRAKATHLLQSLDASMPIVRTFVITDAKGIVTLSNRHELLGFDASERDYVQEPRQQANPNVLYVSVPFKTMLNNFVINFSRPLLDRNAAFDGVVSAAIDTNEVGSLLNSARYADDMQVMLAHRNGTVVASQPATALAPGSHLASGFSDLLSAANPPGNTGAESVVRSVDHQRLAILRTIAPAGLSLDKPLRVLLVRDKAEVFAGWRGDIKNGALFFAFLCVIGVISLTVFERQRAQKIVANKRLKLATEASGVGIWEFDLISKRYYWDDAMFAMFGLDPSRVSERNDDWQRLLSAQDLSRMREATRKTVREGHTFEMTFQITRLDGQVRAMHNRAALYADDEGVPRRLIGATEDVTERRQQEAELRVAAVAFQSTDSMLVGDAQGLILRVNAAFTLLFGFDAIEVVGKNANILKSEREKTVRFSDLWAHLLRDHQWHGELWSRRKDGRDIFCAVSITAVCDDAGQLTHYVATHVDITLRKAAEDEVKRMAFFDPLTQLPNRRLLTDRLQQAINQARRNSTLLAVMYLDLDKFKPVNDSYGHAVGDDLLRMVGQRMLVCVRESDTVARVGGDEFVVLLPDIKQLQDALRVAEKVHFQLRQPFTLTSGLVVNISSSAGIALFPAHGDTEEQLSHNADVAMYMAKAGGRDRFLVFSPDMIGGDDPPPQPQPIPTRI